MRRYISLVLLLFCGTGCVRYFRRDIPLHEKKIERATEVIYQATWTADMEYEINGDMVQYNVDLGDRVQTTGVHPDDSSFLHGETTTQVGSGSEFAPRIGLHYLFGKPHFKFVVGFDARFNPMTSRDDYRTGIFSSHKQVSDGRDSAHAAYVYTQLRPALLTPLPFVGVQYRWKNVLLGGEYAHPYGAFMVSSGHDRFGKWEESLREKWSGWGQRFLLRLGWIYDEEVDYSLGIFHESYSAEFLEEPADIKAWGLMLYIRR